MTNATHGNQTSQVTVYAAIELSKKSWVISIARPDRDQPSIHRITGGNFSELVGRLRTAAKNFGRILVCYEAGYDGFWLARSLAKIGIECRVLDPASIQVNRRARRVKTDRIDVLALLRALIAIDRGERHVCAVVRVPSLEEEDARRSHRERQRLVRERTGHINRIKGLLFAQGIRDIKPKLRLTRIDFAALTTAKVILCQIGYGANSNANMPSRPDRDNNFGGREGTRHGRRQDPAVERKRQMLCALQGIGRHQRGDLGTRGVRAILRQPEATGFLSWAYAERL